MERSFWTPPIRAPSFGSSWPKFEGSDAPGWVNIHTDKIFETDREYFQAFVSLCTPGTPISPGRHQFNLHVQIPASLPSSYESQFGAIRYTVRVILLTNSEQATAVEIFPFYVVASSFFDDIPSAVMQPIDYKDEVDFTVCSFPFGTVYLRISLPRTGYCLGETIAPLIHVKNSTRKNLTDCSVQLVLKSQFEAMSRYEHVQDTKLICQNLDVIPIGRIKGRSEATFNKCRLRIPENVVPSIQHDRPDSESSIIVLSYVLQFTANPGVDMEIPLIITAHGYRNAAAKQPSLGQGQRPVYQQQQTAPISHQLYRQTRSSQEREGSVHYL
ncbi:Arrestin-C domain-containing protein [Aphelenchoides fujianensis]|nr:Arrestin-C domain-containing protein [Aphelenchoides fujianensis]